MSEDGSHKDTDEKNDRGICEKLRAKLWWEKMTRTENLQQEIF